MDAQEDCEAYGLYHTSCMGSVAEGHAVLAIVTACSSMALQDGFLGACRPGVETSSRCFAGAVKLQPLLRLYLLIWWSVYASPVQPSTAPRTPCTTTEAYKKQLCSTVCALYSLCLIARACWTALPKP